MKPVGWIVILVLSMMASACDVIDYFTIARVDSSQDSVAGEDRPPDLYYVSGDSLSAINLGSYCWTSARTGICADMIPPSYEENQHIVLNSHRVEFLFFPPSPDNITVALHPGSSLMSESEEDIFIADSQLEEDGRLIVNIPENIEGRYILTVFARWETYGDAFYTMPILLQQ